MASNYQITYPVDIVLCIDCTGSMRHIIDIVKNNALRLHGDLKAAMEKKSKPLGRTRVRVVAFRDYLAYMKDNLPPMLATPFYDLPAEADKFAAAVRGLEAIGGGDDDEDGLEALGFAMSSPWNTEEHMQRHIIALWTDAKPHELGFGRACPAYPQAMAKNLAELTAWWENSPQDGGKMPRRLAVCCCTRPMPAAGTSFPTTGIRLCIIRRLSIMALVKWSITRS